MSARRRYVSLPKEQYEILKAIADARKLAVSDLVEGLLDSCLEGMQITSVEDVTPVGMGPDTKPWTE